MLKDDIFLKEEAMGTRATTILVAGLVLALAGSSPCPVQAQSDAPRRAVLNRRQSQSGKLWRPTARSSSSMRVPPLSR